MDLEEGMEHILCQIHQNQMDLQRIENEKGSIYTMTIVIVIKEEDINENGKIKQ